MIKSTTRITASEARKISESSVSIEDEYTLDKIEDYIKLKSNEGCTSIYFYDHISYNVQNNLMDRGFYVKDLSSQKDGICYQIKW